MDVQPPKLGWSMHALLTAKLYSRHLCRIRIGNLRKSLTPAQFDYLEATAKQYSEMLTAENQRSKFPMPRRLFDMMCSTEAMLCHPMIIHYIRPATRMAALNGVKIDAIPIITSPSLQLGAQAFRPGVKPVPVAEIRLGSMFLLREVGLGIINLHNAIEKVDLCRVDQYARVCCALSGVLRAHAITAFALSKTMFKDTPFSYRLFASQVTHVLGTFLILHEIAHICLRHDPINREEITANEHEADVFAMKCLFSPKAGNPRYNPFRDVMLAYVCHWLSMIDKEMVHSGSPLHGHPAYSDRREKLLDHFKASEAVRRSASQFDGLMKASPHISSAGIDPRYLQ